MCKPTDDPEKELLEKEILSREIKYFQSFVPDVFFCADRSAMCKHGSMATVLD